eukprot:Sspe_Gene.85075::Locus_55892_Transcript_1_1_Confidence_1.000_Length_511::g.85075::m.85075
MDKPSSGPQPAPGWSNYLPFDMPTRCTNSKLDDEDNFTPYSLPPRCRGLFGRVFGLYYDMQPFERVERRLGWNDPQEHGTPPPPPEGSEAPAQFEIITTSGRTIVSDIK